MHPKAAYLALHGCRCIGYRLAQERYYIIYRDERHYIVKQTGKRWENQVFSRVGYKGPELRWKGQRLWDALQWKLIYEFLEK